MTDGRENAKRNVTSALPTIDSTGMATAASSGSADALMMPAAPLSPIIANEAKISPSTPSAMYSTPRTRT